MRTFGPGVLAAGSRTWVLTLHSDRREGAVHYGELLVTVTDVGPSLIESMRSADHRRFDGLSVLDTTELRWFVPGPTPPDVDALFSGSTGIHEQRCDTYLLDGRHDVGVKRRSRELLEVKVRQSLDGRIQLGAGLDGQLEVWRKWSPVEGLVDDGSVPRWGDVCKSIVKRRFSVNGSETTFLPNAHLASAGCDIEVAAVSVGAVHAWTFALEAFGPRSTRRGSLLASFQALLGAAPRPESFRLCAGRAMGYPEWLAQTVSPDVFDRWAQAAVAGSR